MLPLGRILRPWGTQAPIATPHSFQDWCGSFDGGFSFALDDCWHGKGVALPPFRGWVSPVAWGSCSGLWGFGIFGPLGRLSVLHSGAVCFAVAHLLQPHQLPLHPQPFSFPSSLPEEHLRLLLLCSFGLPMDKQTGVADWSFLMAPSKTCSKTSAVSSGTTSSECRPPHPCQGGPWKPPHTPPDGAFRASVPSTRRCVARPQTTILELHREVKISMS